MFHAVMPRAQSGKKKVLVWSEDRARGGGIRLGDLGERRELPYRVRGRAPAENDFGAV